MIGLTTDTNVTYLEKRILATGDDEAEEKYGEVGEEARGEEERREDSHGDGEEKREDVLHERVPETDTIRHVYSQFVLPSRKSLERIIENKIKSKKWKKIEKIEQIK